MSLTSSRQSVCLSVQREYGELAIRTAKKLGALDETLKIRSEDDRILIPLARRLSDSEHSNLCSLIEDFYISSADFPMNTRRPKTILEALEDTLPPHLLASLPNSLDIVGNIAIVHVPEELTNHTRELGEAIMRVNRHVRTVLRKIGSVEGQLRVRQFQLIAGEDKTETLHKEFGCKYRVDPTKVYFSPRLSSEHDRVASKVKNNEVVLDMFAGVGPFSILIGKRHSDVKVYAVDVNPDAIRFLKENVDLNRVRDRVVPIQGDVQSVIRNQLKGVADRIIMNLPLESMRFIDVACEAFKTSGGTIHYYAFGQDPDALDKARRGLVRAVAAAGKELLEVTYGETVKSTAPHEQLLVIDANIGSKKRSDVFDPV